MSPVLFLFVMAAFAETLEIEWEKENIPKVEFHHTPFQQIAQGQLISHPANKLSNGEIFEIIQTLFVDDGAFVFESRNDLARGLELIQKVFAMFGLEMHTGKIRGKSKTECMFIPAPQFFTPPKPLTCDVELPEGTIAKK